MLDLPSTIDGLELHKWKTYENWYDHLLEIPITDDNYRDWLAEWSKVAQVVNEGGAELYRLHTLNTADEAIKVQWFTYLEDAVPNITRVVQKLEEKLLTINIADDDLQVPLRKIRSDVTLFREENLPLETEAQKLTAKYTEITGNMEAEWDGETKSVGQLRQLVEGKDRPTRERAWTTLMGLWGDVRPELNNIYLEQIKLRDQTAKNAGFDDYRAYIFQQKHRFEYTPDDCLQFHDAIEQVAVPAVLRVLARKRERMGVDVIRPWDYVPEIGMIVDTDKGGPLTPYRDQADLIGTSQTIFDNLNPILGNYFRAMAEGEMLDLESHSGKALGGYCQTFPLRKLPYIFMNGMGSSDNVQTLFHEAGHAFHSMEVMHNLPLMIQRRANMEFNEVAAMGMESLAAPYLSREKGGFYESEAEAARHRIEHLESRLLFFPYMATVDAFQHWVYTNVDEVLAGGTAVLDAQWDAIWQRMVPGVDWTGWEHVRESGWHRKRHIFRYPFYYIEYGIAQVGALQVWQNSIDDHAQALAQYRYALSLGGTRTLPQLFEAAGAELRFDAAMLGELITLVEGTIDTLLEEIA